MLNPSNFIAVDSHDSGGKSFLLHFASLSFRNVHSDKISEKTIFLGSSWRQISALLVIFLMSELNISVGWYIGETQPFFILKNSECFHSLGFRILVARSASAGKSLHLFLISRHNCHTTSWWDFSSSTIPLAYLPIILSCFFQFSLQLGSS